MQGIVYKLVLASNLKSTATVTQQYPQSAYQKKVKTNLMSEVYNSNLQEIIQCRGQC